MSVSNRRDRRDEDRNRRESGSEEKPFVDEPKQEDLDYGDDAPIAQGPSSVTDVPEDVSPGDEVIMIDEKSGNLIDLSDVEEMEEYASIANTGGVGPLVVDSDVEEHTSNPNEEDILADFNDRMQIVGGSERLMEELSNYHGLSPKISGNDVDAAWTDADQSGEEGVGGSVPTPDQDVVEELGEAVGIEYSDDEPLNTEEKLNARDEDRWELNPESQDDDENGGEGRPDVGGYGAGMENEDL